MNMRKTNRLLSLFFLPLQNIIVSAWYFPRSLINGSLNHSSSFVPPSPTPWPFPASVCRSKNTIKAGSKLGRRKQSKFLAADRMQTLWTHSFFQLSLVINPPDLTGCPTEHLTSLGTSIDASELYRIRRSKDSGSRIVKRSVGLLAGLSSVWSYCLIEWMQPLKYCVLQSF